MFSRVKVSSCNFLLPKLLDIRSETFCSFLFESHDYNVTQSKNCITVNNNYQSSLNNNIVDDCCFTACCHSSSQQEMFLLLTESSVCDRYRTFNWQSEVWLMLAVMISKPLPDLPLLSGSACLSADAAADFTTTITQKEFLHTEGLTSVCHLRQKLSFKQTNTFILLSTSAAWTSPGTLTCTLGKV